MQGSKMKQDLNLARGLQQYVDTSPVASNKRLGTLVQGQPLAPEVEKGNREYKLMLTNLSDEQLRHRCTQLNWRLNEGNGEMFYLVGVEDNGNQLGLTESELRESLKNLQFMANEVGCDMSVSAPCTAVRGVTVEVRMKRKERQSVNITQLAIAVAGDVDSGKSSLIGVLTSGHLDNGKGLARSSVCTHNHELESGRTSCISHHSLHFDKDGQVLNADQQLSTKHTSAHRLRALSELELADTTERVVTLIDLAGHAKYLKTTLHGMMGRHPQYSLICVSAVSGLQSMTTEHIGISLYLKVPLIIAVTKIDLATAAQLEATMKQVMRLLTGPNKQGMIIKTTEELVEFLRLVNEQRAISLMNEVASEGTLDANIKPMTYAPVFQVSNVIGTGLELLQSCFHKLPVNTNNGNPTSVVTHSTTTVKSQATAKKNAVVVRILRSIGSGLDAASDDEELSAEEEEKPVVLRRCNFNPRTKSVAEGGSVSEKDSAADFEANETTALTGGSISENVMSTGTSTDSLCLSEVSGDSHSSGGNGGTVAASNNIGSASSLVDNSAVVAAFEFAEYIESATTTLGMSSVGNSSVKVLFGHIESGVLAVGDILLLGPSSQGVFVNVAIGSIRLNNVPIQIATAGQTVTFKLVACVAESTNSTGATVGSVGNVDTTHRMTPVKTSTGGGALSTRSTPVPSPSNIMHSSKGVSKRSTVCGLVLLSSDALASGESTRIKAVADDRLTPTAYWEFDAEILILNHRNKIRVNYEPVIHVGCVKQAARIISMRKIKPIVNISNEINGGVSSNTFGNGIPDVSVLSLTRTDSDVLESLCNGEKAICRFRFLYYPEYLTVNSALIIREERTKGVGTVLKLVA